MGDMRRGHTQVTLVLKRTLSPEQQVALLEKLEAHPYIQRHEGEFPQDYEKFAPCSIFRAGLERDWWIIVKDESPLECYIGVSGCAHDMDLHLGEMVETLADMSGYNGAHEIKFFVEGQWAASVEFASKKEFLRLKQRFLTLLRTFLMLAPKPTPALTK